MTYSELEDRVKLLEGLLGDALKTAMHPSDCTLTPHDDRCSCWIEKAWQALAPPAPPKQDIFSGHRWEGEICAECRHSSVFHPRGGICTKANCDCCKFAPSGKTVETTT